MVMHHRTVIANASHELFCVRVIESSCILFPPKTALSCYPLMSQLYALFPTMPFGTLKGVGVNLLFSVKDGQ